MDPRLFREALEQVDVLRRERRFDEALRRVDALLTQHPESSELLVRRGMLLQLSAGDGPLQEIEQCLRTAHLLSPANVEAAVELGHFLYAVRDQANDALPCFAAAVHQAEAALKQALIGQIKCHIELADWAAVMDTLDTAERYFPDDIDLRMQRAEVEEARGRL